MSGRRHELPLGTLVYEIDRGLDPVLEVDPGDAVVVETEDAFTGQIRREGDVRDKRTMPLSNPVRGPIAVAGAEPEEKAAVVPVAPAEVSIPVIPENSSTLTCVSADDG